LVLIFLIILAFLALAILGELERGKDAPAPPPGACPGCSAKVETDWLLCPRCRTRIAEHCPGCGQVNTRFHAFCPFCGLRKGAMP
jgi:hypothetical protein